MDKDLVSIVKKNSEKEREKLSIKAFKLMAEGVEIIDPNRLDIRGNLTCGENVKIDINVIIEGDVSLADGVSIGANCILKDCQIGKDTLIHPFSSIDGSVIGKSCFVGPYGRIRPDSYLGNSVQIGNFVEIKNATINSWTRINHLSFIGDADLAEGVTIGAGTITCNHDGFDFNHITIHEGSYIGSGCNLIAPLIINKNSTIAAGSTITDEVPSEVLTIARSRQVTIDSWKGRKSK
ncbi:bifunctional protein glmU [Candidatus Pseudothioglobus singularis]|nr:bifunctional protein glmU [Candidatus Pseudothioglobus singularis]